MEGRKEGRKEGEWSMKGIIFADDGMKVIDRVFDGDLGLRWIVCDLSLLHLKYSYSETVDGIPRSVLIWGKDIQY
jgi:hypothetical protein